MTNTTKEAPGVEACIAKLRAIEVAAGSYAEGAGEPEFSRFCGLELRLRNLREELIAAQQQGAATDKDQTGGIIKCGWLDSDNHCHRDDGLPCERPVCGEHGTPVRVAPQQPHSVETTAGALSDAGWRCAANWAEREDLLADTDSPAYAEEREAALKKVERPEGAQQRPTSGQPVRSSESGRMPPHNPDSAPARQERSDAAGSATLPASAAAAAHSEELRGLRELHTAFNHEAEPHCCGCYNVGLNLVAVCNECGHRVDLSAALEREGK